MQDPFQKTLERASSFALTSEEMHENPWSLLVGNHGSLRSCLRFRVWLGDGVTTTLKVSYIYIYIIYQDHPMGVQ